MTQTSPKLEDIQDVGTMFRALQDISPERAPDIIALDKAFEASGGNISKCASEIGTSYLDTTRSLCKSGRINQSDPRFRAAFNYEIMGSEGRNQVQSTNAPIKDLKSEMRRSGDQRSLLEASALLELMDKKGSKDSSVTLASSIEKLAMDPRVSSDIQQNALLVVVAQTDAAVRQKQINLASSKSDPDISR